MIKIIQIMKKNQHVFYVSFSLIFLSFCCKLEISSTCSRSNYWQLLSQRASGKLKTNARWIRDYISKHPSYRYVKFQRNDSLLRLKPENF